MNQILITKKLYVTPELKKKKKLYKFEFFLSIFLVVVLISVYIYAEHDRNKSEEVSQEILANLDIPEEDTTVVQNNILVVVLNDTIEDEEPEQNANSNNNKNNNSRGTKQKIQGGFEYTTIATVTIPKINLTYPVIDGPTDTAEETEALLKISPTKFWGPNPNEVGNFCIVGHNYRNNRFFSKVPTLVEGDSIEITDLEGKTIQYKVYTKYQVEPTDVSCTTQVTNGRREITLITCTDDSKQRVVVKARQVK